MQPILKQNKNGKENYNINLWGALLLSPLCSRAVPYELQWSLVSSNHKNLGGHRSPKRPLAVDLVGHTLTVPSQVVGYTLTLESESGDVYTSIIMGNRFVIPQELDGVFEITLGNNDVAYKGTIEIK